MNFDSFGDRMKEYEGAEAGRRVMRHLPILARLDGRAFHTFCRGLNKPYDQRFHDLMCAVTTRLVEETGALVGYTQSDEISLVWYSADPKSQVFFDGRIQKLVSILAAMASVEFFRLLPAYLPEKVGTLPQFDCRVWGVPTLEEAANTFLWREQDATRNSILALGQAHFSHKRLQGVNTKLLQELLFQEAGVNWSTSTPDWAKRGTWIRRVRGARRFSVDELERLPLKHAARTNPDLLVERWEVQRTPMPRFGSVLNRVAVLFEGAEPIVDGSV